MTRRRSHRQVAFLVALTLPGCNTSTEFSDTLIESFVTQSGLPNTTGPFYYTRLTRYDLQTFSIGFGEVVECPGLLRLHLSAAVAECRSAIGIGLRLGERVGWLKLEQEGITLPEDENRFDVTGGDDPVLNGAMWDVFKVRDAEFYNIYFKEHVVRDPDTPLLVLHRIADELPEFMSPTCGHLLLDSPIAAADRTLVEKLAALPVFQGDPYAEVRTRAAQLLST